MNDPLSITAAARDAADAIALHVGRDSYTFAQLADLVQTRLADLRSELVPGRPVPLVGRNTLERVIALYTLLEARVPVLLLHPKLTEADRAAEIAATARAAGTLPADAAIIMYTSASQQPMVDSELGLALVFNGCIYNFRALRGELEAKGYRFFSDGDTEVILKAYDAWGPRCVERFHGMFAFAMWERDSGRVVLARDRLGIKPLYLADVDSGRALRFASTLPALLAAGGVNTDIDPAGLHHYMSFHAVVPAPAHHSPGRPQAPARDHHDDRAGRHAPRGDLLVGRGRCERRRSRCRRSRSGASASWRR